MWLCMEVCGRVPSRRHEEHGCGDVVCDGVVTWIACGHALDVVEGTCFPILDELGMFSLMRWMLLCWTSWGCVPLCLLLRGYSPCVGCCGDGSPEWMSSGT